MQKLKKFFPLAGALLALAFVSCGSDFDSDSKTAGSISYATTSVSKATADGAFTNALTKTGDGTVSYASSKTDVAEVNATTGQVTIKGAGEATITATVADSDAYTYATKTASYTLTVKQATTTLVLKPAFENDATVRIAYTWNRGRGTTTFDFKNTDGTYECTVSGSNSEYFSGSLEKSDGNLKLSIVFLDELDEELANRLHLSINFDSNNNSYTITKKGSYYYSFSISVNDEDITSQLEEVN